MDRIAAALIATLLLAVAGEVQARQPAAAPPQFVAQPSPQALVAAYPSGALQEKTAGRAVVKCKVRDGGGVTGCLVIEEQPKNSGFGDAVLALMPQYQVKMGAGKTGPAADPQRVSFAISWLPPQGEGPAAKPAVSARYARDDAGSRYDPYIGAVGPCVWSGMEARQKQALVAAAAKAEVVTGNHDASQDAALEALMKRCDDGFEAHAAVTRMIVDAHLWSEALLQTPVGRRFDPASAPQAWAQLPKDERASFIEPTKLLLTDSARGRDVQAELVTDLRAAVADGDEEKRWMVDYFVQRGRIDAIRDVMGAPPLG